MSDPTEIPMDGGAPESPAPPPEPSQAELLYQGLQNLDTRGERLNDLLRPGQDLPDGMTWQEARSALFAMQQQEAEPEPDPWDQFAPDEPQLLGYDAQGQPVWDAPQQQAPAFDPRSLAPVFESQRDQIKREIMAEFQQQQMQHAQEMNLSQGVRSASEKHSLSEYDANIVRMQTEQAMRQHPNRAPADLADDVAKAYIENMNARFVAQGGTPPAPQGQVPSGPIPGDQKPKTFAELNEFWKTQVSPQA